MLNCLIQSFDCLIYMYYSCLIVVSEKVSIYMYYSCLIVSEKVLIYMYYSCLIVVSEKVLIYVLQYITFTLT